ncbi:MAG: hypothetical protein WC861_04265 [Candidatus Micrarchaeia archaeon]|jgi:hypothetical protein
MGGANKRIIKNCANSLGRDEKDKFLRALQKAPQFEYSKEMEEKLHNMLRMGDNKWFSLHHRELVALVRKNPFNLQYILNIYFSGDETVSLRAHRVLTDAWFKMDGAGALQGRFGKSQLLVETMLKQGDMSEFDVIGNFIDYDGKMPSFDVCLRNYCHYYADSNGSGKANASNPAGLATEEMMRKVISEIKSGDVGRLKRAVGLLESLHFGEDMVSDGSILSLLENLRPLDLIVKKGVAEKANMLAKTPLWRDQDAVMDILDPYYDVQHKFGKIVHSLEHEYKERTGAPPMFSETKKLPFTAQKLLNGMSKK